MVLLAMGSLATPPDALGQRRRLLEGDVFAAISPPIDLIHARAAVGEIDRRGYQDFLVTGLTPETLVPRSYVYEFQQEDAVVVANVPTYTAVHSRRLSPLPPLWGDLFGQDLTGDGIPDYVSVGVPDTSATTSPSSAAGLVGPLGGLSVSLATASLAVANGRLAGRGASLASTGRTADGTVALTVLRRTGPNVYTRLGPWPGLQLGAMDFGDCDGDGDDDLVLTGVDADFRPATLLGRNTDGTFAFSALDEVPGMIGGMLRLIDFDGDGADDLVVSGGLYGPTGLEARTEMRRAVDCTFTTDRTPPGQRFLRTTSAVVADLQTRGPALLLNVHTGETAAELFEYTLPFAPTAAPRRRIASLLDARLMVGDYNNDTIEDLLVIGHRVGLRTDGTAGLHPAAYFLRSATWEYY